jgi:hypothetical protein
MVSYRKSLLTFVSESAVTNVGCVNAEFQGQLCGDELVGIDECSVPIGPCLGDGMQTFNVQGQGHCAALSHSVLCTAGLTLGKLDE